MSAVLLRYTLFFILFASSGCRKFIELDSPVLLDKQAVYSSDASASAVMSGIYIKMADNSFFTGGPDNNWLTMCSGLATDEFFNYSKKPNQLTIYLDAWTVQNSTFSSGYWGGLYNLIYSCNSVLEGIASSSTLSENVKNQLTGEALFVRALCHFYLTNLFGAAPIVKTTDYRVNNTLPRSSQEEVYQQVEQDLIRAKELLSPDYRSADAISSTDERTRPNRFTASALLSRVYLYTKQWSKAIDESSSIIQQSGTYEILSDLDQVFLKNSKETIWQLQPGFPGLNTREAFYFVLTFGVNSFLNTISLSDTLYNSFQAEDLRRQHWIGKYDIYYYPYKYKVNAYDPTAPVTEYNMMFRLSEQFLIRAEAKAEMDNIQGAEGGNADLNIIRLRAGLNPLNLSDKAALIDSVSTERRHEFFAENGDRWFNLARLQKLDAVMPQIAASKGGIWSSEKKLFPVPNSELIRNANLNPQNPGYTQ